MRAPVKPFTQFIKAAEIVIANCPAKVSASDERRSRVTLGDARRLTFVADSSIDMVLSSPPYLNAIDYMRCSKFSLVWMGHSIAELRRVRSASVGSEVGLAAASNSDWIGSLLRRMQLTSRLRARDLGHVSRYAFDLQLVIAEAARVLKPGGKAIYVVGDTCCRGTYVRNSTILTRIAQRAGLVLTDRTSRALPSNRRYLPPPKLTGIQSSIDSRMRREVVLVFQKS